jgi:hypothetical protein
MSVPAGRLARRDAPGTGSGLGKVVVAGHDAAFPPSVTDVKGGVDRHGVPVQPVEQFTEAVLVLLDNHMITQRPCLLPQG